MCVQIVLDKCDLVGVGKVDIAEIFRHVRVVDGRPPLGQLAVTPAFQRRKQHEHVDRSVTLVFVVMPRGLSVNGGPASHNG